MCARRVVMVLVAFAAAVAAHGAGEVFPFFDFINHGYDVIKGSPFSSQDGGWRTAKVRYLPFRKARACRFQGCWRWLLGRVGVATLA